MKRFLAAGLLIVAILALGSGSALAMGMGNTASNYMMSGGGGGMMSGTVSMSGSFNLTGTGTMAGTSGSYVMSMNMTSSSTGYTMTGTMTGTGTSSGGGYDITGTMTPAPGGGYTMTGTMTGTGSFSGSGYAITGTMTPTPAGGYTMTGTMTGTGTSTGSGYTMTGSAGGMMSTTMDSGMPALGMSTAGSPFWASYTDYTNGRLSVTYEINNSTGHDAYNLMITGSMATNGVIPGSSMPTVVGDIASGSNAPVTMTYMVPSGVTQFRTYNSVTCIDQVGNQYSYGGSPTT